MPSHSSCLICQLEAGSENYFPLVSRLLSKCVSDVTPSACRHAGVASALQQHDQQLSLFFPPAGSVWLIASARAGAGKLSDPKSKETARLPP